MRENDKVENVTVDSATGSGLLS